MSPSWTGTAPSFVRAIAAMCGLASRPCDLELVTEVLEVAAGAAGDVQQRDGLRADARGSASVISADSAA